MSTFIGKPCKNCGGTERYLSGNKPCVECAKRNSQRRWDEGKTAEWKKKKKEQVNACNRRRYNSLTQEEKRKRNRAQQVSLYGLTLEQYDAMLEKQNGVCAICLHPEIKPNKSMSIDHNHTTGKVRALLCDRCNRGIGIFEEDIALFQTCIEYLKEHK